MRLIDADALTERMKSFLCAPTKCDNYGGIKCRACQFDDAFYWIDAEPTVDAVPPEVVTCQDCKYFAIKDYWGDFNGHPILVTSDAPICTKWGTGDCLTRPDGFCFIGERREADDETD